jgi:hypothetical protein
MSRIESGVRIVLAFNEAFNQHDVAGMMQLTNEDCSFEDASPPPNGMLYTGKVNVNIFLQDSFQKYPNAHKIIEEIFGFGVRCVTRWRIEWEDEYGEKKFNRGVDIYLLKNGLIFERISYVKG